MTIQLVREQGFYLSSSTRNRFYVKSYLPVNNNPTGIVLIIPGMAEHTGRYRDFANFLAENHYGVYACDHPGQGKTAASSQEVGVVSGSEAWQQMLENVRALYSNIRKNQPEIPVFLFGHSMGSILARHFTALYPVYLQGIILSGSFMPNPLIISLARAFINIKILFGGSNKKSIWFNTLFYKNFNRHFKHRPTLFEWISSERSEVDAYVKDPYCGINYSNGFYKNLFSGIAATRQAEKLLTYRKSLPLLILSGEDDPVGNFGKDAVKLHKEFYGQKFQNLYLKIFPGRHELLHEKNKEAVYQFLLDWLNKRHALKISKGMVL
ncbi:MAG: alpha/beta hydrolase [Bacteroidales bacterium]|nr:alpha/beta hydrolase [Bacteroidales bacterium]